MTGLLKPMLLAALHGGAVGLVARRAAPAPRPAAALAVATRVAGGVAAGFLLPQTGLPVSRSMGMGLTFTAAGAGIAVGALRLAMRGRSVTNGRLGVFRALALLGVALGLLDAGLVLASLALAPRLSGHLLAVSAAVALVFAAVAGLLDQVRRGLTDAVVAVGRRPPLSDAAASLRRLLLPMILGALAVDGALLLMAFAFADRMRQGCAVFG